MGLGRAAAGIAVVAVALAQRSFAADADDRRHLHFDYQSNCAVFDSERSAALSATWSGECIQGLASGRGTAVYIRADQSRETVSATFLNGRVQDGPASIQWSDGTRFEGEIASGVPDGAGVLTRANGDRFNGTWKHGALKGHGSIVWAGGDRYDGEFVDGRAEGHGVQVWANGDRYEGDWHNNLPSGTGTVTRKGGGPIAAHFVDGKLQTPIPTHPAPTLPTSAPAADRASTAVFLSALVGSTLSALDGTSVRFETADGGVLRTITSADGHVDKTAFALLNHNLGTISSDDVSGSVIGFFRATDSTLSAEYSDGRVERLALITGGGLNGFFESAAGRTACMSWYPTGHVFSVDERKAAVSAYAQRLGVSLRTTAKATPSCAAPPQVASLVVPTTQLVHPVIKQASVALTRPPYRLGDGPANLEIVPVRDSIVHSIDGPAAAIAPNRMDTTADEAIASKCLKVDSDGRYWGFRNHCSYSVQFSYCLLRDATVPCGERGEGNASGSVAGNGFSALFADTSLSGGVAEHDFRWVACRGGAGEVEARIDVVEPASGRCLQRASLHQQQASN